MGGRGKTPVTILLARMLVAAGQRPAILSRGYKRARPDDGVTVVSDGARILADLDRSGDEPLMMAEAVPGAAVLVCDVRAMAGAVAEEQLGATVHILDDGFQHSSLARDIDVVIVAPEDLRGRRLPFGTLRSPVSSLKKAAAVLIDAEAGEAAAIPEGPVSFHLRRSLGMPSPIGGSAPPPDPREPVVAVAGIAEPARFARALTAAGWTVADAVGFADHHAYTRRDLERVVRVARQAGARAVLTTEKDAIRLRSLAPFPLPFAAVPLTVAIEPASAFGTWFFGRLARTREARA